VDVVYTYIYLLRLRLIATTSVVRESRCCSCRSVAWEWSRCRPGGGRERRPLRWWRSWKSNSWVEPCSIPLRRWSKTLGSGRSGTCSSDRTASRCTPAVAARRRKPRNRKIPRKKKTEPPCQSRGCFPRRDVRSRRHSVGGYTRRATIVYYTQCPSNFRPFRFIIFSCLSRARARPLLKRAGTK